MEEKRKSVSVPWRHDEGGKEEERECTMEA